MELLRDNAGILGGIAAAVVVYVLWKMLRPAKKVIHEDMKLNVRCTKCSWQGTVTKYNKVCRKCGSKDVAAF